jgi:beta-phosphoglucomutase
MRSNALYSTALIFFKMQTLRIPELIETPVEGSDWIVLETQFDAAKLHHKETVFTLGNGYLGTRGTFEESYPGAMPATLIHGVYDDVPVVYTELANCPDWLPLVIWVEGDRFSLNRGQVLSYQRQLDLQRGVLSRDIRWRSPRGNTVDLHFERFTSLADQHVLAIRCQITPVDFDGEIEVHAGINGYSHNQGVLHWEWLDQGGTETSVWLHQCSRHSHIELSMGSHLTVSDGFPVKLMNSQGYPTLTTTFHAQPGKTVTLDKLVTVFTSRDTVTPTPAAQQKLAQLPSYDTLLADHIAAWEEVWQACDVVIEGDTKAQLAIRYNLFQILAAAPRHDDRVSIPAKTLSGFGYRGHVFWDTEIFLVPFLTYSQPAVARNLLTYRYHTLSGARCKAHEAGYEGAMFSWESADTGNEVTPRWVHSPDGQHVIRIWCGDIELHITTDVAYAVWHYWQATGDDEWMREYGAEIILDTAVFWGSRAQWNSDRHCYEICNVIGPDENHDGINNNAFTNRMVQWHLETAFSVLTWLQTQSPNWAAELAHQLNLTPTRLERWADIIQHILVLEDANTGLIEQFEGFFALEDVNLADYEPRTRSMQALLGIEETSKRQILKQADVLMLLYLLRDRYTKQAIQTNWDYYNPRTDHTYGSSLGPAIHAILACDMGDPIEAYNHYMRAALVDLEDVRRNAEEGIHAASAGGVWQAIVFGFGGIRLTETGPVANPNLPPGWSRLKFRLQWRNHWYEFDCKNEEWTMEQIPQSKIQNPHSQAGAWERANIVQGVIFDLDGVLTDTAEFHYLGWKRLADEEGLPFSREANEALRGVARRDSLLYILGKRPATEAQLQEMMDRKNRYYLEFIHNLNPTHLLPGVTTLLDDLKTEGIKIALGSSSKNARDVIRRLGIAEKIDAIADGYSVVNPKPAPDVFLHAAEQLGLPPAQCLVVEDADAGVTAALAAGMWAVKLGSVESASDAHVVLPNLDGIRWHNLLEKIEPSQEDAIAR